MQCTPPEQLTGYNALLRYYDYVLADWVVVGGTDDLKLPKVMREKIVINADNGDGTVHYMVLPQSDAEDVDITVDFLPSQYRKMLNMIQLNPAPIHDWQVILNSPDQFTVEWCGALLELGAEIPKKEVVRSDIKVGYMGGHLRSAPLAEL